MTSGARNCVHCGPEEAAVAARERVRRSCLCILCLFRLITELFHSQATTASIPRDHLCRHCTLPISHSSFSYFDQKGAGRISILGISTAGAELHVVWHVNWSHLPPGPLDVGLYQSTFLSFSTKLDPADSDVSSHSKSCQIESTALRKFLASTKQRLWRINKKDGTCHAAKQSDQDRLCGCQMHSTVLTAGSLFSLLVHLRPLVVPGQAIGEIGLQRLQSAVGEGVWGGALRQLEPASKTRCVSVGGNSGTSSGGMERWRIVAVQPLLLTSYVDSDVLDAWMSLASPHAPNAPAAVEALLPATSR